MILAGAWVVASPVDAGPRARLPVKHGTPGVELAGGELAKVVFIHLCTRGTGMRPALMQTSVDWQ